LARHPEPVEDSSGLLFHVHSLSHALLHFVSRRCPHIGRGRPWRHTTGKPAERNSPTAPCPLASATSGGGFGLLCLERGAQRHRIDLAAREGPEGIDALVEEQLVATD